MNDEILIETPGYYVTHDSKNILANTKGVFGRISLKSNKRFEFISEDQTASFTVLPSEIENIDLTNILALEKCIISKVFA